MSEHVEISKRLLLINSVSAVVQKVGSVCVLIWLQQHLVRHISAEEYALYAVVHSLILFVPLLMLVMASSLGRFVVESFARGDERRACQVVSTAAPMCGAMALVILALGAVVTINVQHIFTISDHLLFDARVMLATLFASAALTTANMPFIVGLLVKQKFVWVDALNLSAMLVFVAVLFALLLGIETRAMWVTIATVPQLLVSQGGQVLMSRRVLPVLKVRLRDFRGDLVMPLLTFGGWTMAARVAQVCRIACGPLVLKEFPAAVAQTGRDLQVGAFKLGGVAETKLLPLTTVPLLRVLPALTAMYATGQIDRLRRSFYRLTRYLLWLYLLLAVPLIVYHRELFTLYTGGRYPSAGLVMALLIAKAAVIFPQPLLDQLTSAQGDKRQIAMRVIITESLVTAGMVLAVVGYGADAAGMAAVSLALTCVLYPPLFWTFAIRITQSTWSKWLREVMVRGLIPTAVALPVWTGLSWLVPAGSWLALATDCAIGGAIYLLAIVALCLQPSERDDVRALLSKLGRRGRKAP